MTLYLDSSALLKRYIDEHDSSRYNSILDSDAAWLTCRLTWVEVWRNLGRRLPGPDAAVARDAFRADWQRLAVVEVDAVLAEDAGRMADLTGSRSLDALHLAALERVGPSSMALVTAEAAPGPGRPSVGLDRARRLIAAAAIGALPAGWPATRAASSKTCSPDASPRSTSL